MATRLNACIKVFLYPMLLVMASSPNHFYKCYERVLFLHSNSAPAERGHKDGILRRSIKDLLHSFLHSSERVKKAGEFNRELHQDKFNSQIVLMRNLSRTIVSFHEGIKEVTINVHS